MNFVGRYLILSLTLLTAISFADSLPKAPVNINGDALSIPGEKNPSGGLGILTKFTDKKGMVVVFLSAKCPCSNSHVPELKKLAEKYSDFKFIAINSNMGEPLEFAQKYFSLVQLPFPVIRDRKTQAADDFKAYKTPHVFLVSPNGEILYQGGVTSSANAAVADKHFLEEAMEDVQLGKKVRVAENRTLGCVIKREGEKNDWK